jgi:hypothetical protein
MPARNPRREVFSSSLQELMREGKKSNSTRATPSIVMCFLLFEEGSCCVLVSHYTT